MEIPLFRVPKEKIKVDQRYEVKFSIRLVKYQQKRLISYEVYTQLITISKSLNTVVNQLKINLDLVDRKLSKRQQKLRKRLVIKLWPNDHILIRLVSAKETKTKSESSATLSAVEKVRLQPKSK